MSDAKKSNVKRRPRILAIQKKLLVQLIENHFIRMTGTCSNVNFEAIEPSAFDRFAEILNSWGVRKTSREWKSSFYYMKNRVRRSVEMILNSSASVKDNLSDLDFKLYSMSPSWFHGAFEGRVGGIDNVLRTDVVKEETIGIGIGGTDFFDNSDDHDRTEDHQNTDNVAEEANDFNLNYNVEYYEDKIDDIGESEEQGSENFVSENSRRVLVADNMEELENFMESPIILSEDEEQIIPQRAATENQSENYDTEALEYYPSAKRNLNDPPPLSKRVYGASKEGQLQAVGGKIPELQKERLIQLVQNNFMRAFGRFAGANGAYIKAQFWESTAKELNLLGPPRTGKQWKTTFNNIKASAKSKLADDHNNFGGLVTKPLSRLEEKVLSIYGMNALDGIQDLGEAGFQYKQTVPVSRRVRESTVTSGAFENLSKSTENIEETFEEPTERGAENSNTDQLITAEDSHEEAALPDDNGDSVPEFLYEMNSPNRSEMPEETSNLENGDSYHHSKNSSTYQFRSSSADRSRGSSRRDNYGRSSCMSPIGSLNEMSSRNRPEIPNETSNLENGNSSSSRSRGHSSYHHSTSSHDPNSNASHERATASTSVSNRSPRQSGIRDQELRSFRSANRFNFQSENSSSSQLRSSSANRGSSRRDHSGSSRMQTIGNNYSDRARGASYNVRGVPRLHVRRPLRRSSSREQMEEITNINQLFRDGGRDYLDEENDRARNESIGADTTSRSRSTNDRNADQTVAVARVERDRSNLRHRFTSFEMVQRSMEAQDRFIEDNNRNHSEFMYITDRNHMEMLSIFNATLRTFSNVADKFVNKM